MNSIRFLFFPVEICNRSPPHTYDANDDETDGHTMSKEKKKKELDLNCFLPTSDTRIIIIEFMIL